ncbi:MAG: tRNA preQ1(34) S-adenosylmethionine ribosyltransferase-isomerase QueA [Acholeplasmataceae bacterium]
MNIADFDFELPKTLIAQHPSQKRDHSRLMVVDRKTQALSHHNFYDIISFLGDEDVLVINDSKVLPARLMGEKTDTGAHIEVLLLKEIAPDQWEALSKPAKKVKVGTQIKVSDLLTLTCVQIKEEGIRVYDLAYEGLFIEVLERLGEMPLPPYITQRLVDQSRYQTVYAKDPGSAAAPTAGLHFTPELLDKLRLKGVTIVPITLHVGLGTFKPVDVDDIEKHHMHEETYTMSESSAMILNQAKKDKKRITCVGTTSIRTLESNYNNGFHPGTFQTNIFIYPGYQFKTVDQLITNFHLPKSTLIMLISALASVPLIKEAYMLAINQNYRFFSFGDAMLIK